MKRVAVAIALVFLTSAVASAGDRDVKTVTAAIEKQYGVKHKGLPLIARIAMKPALWGSGVKMDLAMFENMPALAGHDLEVDTLLKSTLGPDWTRFVRVESRKTGERNVIYVHTVGDKLEMMIVSIEPDEAVVLKMRIKPEDMQKWIDEPGEMALKGDHHDHTTQQAPTQQPEASSAKTRNGFVRTGTE